VKVYSICIIVLGNTYYYVLRGPLQNLEVVSQWANNWFMYVILQADLQAGIFFAITAFLLSYQYLKRIKANEGVYWTHPIRIVIERYLRLTPLYFFMMIFLTKFVGLLGGRGPMFY